MNINESKKITLNLIETFKIAGNAALGLRRNGLKIQIKADKTPVTDADLEVNKILTERISLLTPNIPIISEENSNNKNIKELKNFWLIDPIDGTKDYIDNRDEFTLNAGLIINNRPLIGIVTAPGKKRIFYAYSKSNSYELVNDNEINLSTKKKEVSTEIKAVSYANKLRNDILEIHKSNNITYYQKMKSSYKFCVVAAGEFDLYAAEPRASEWDIAAGHAILEHSGGQVTDFDGNEILYGKKDFKNPSLILKSKNIL